LVLETMRRNSRSAIIYVLFGILIAVFVLSFGPGSRGFIPSSAASNVAAKVAGSTLTEQDFRFVYNALDWSQMPPQMAKERHLKEFAMDRLIEREILAAEAERLGFLVSAREVEDMIADGRMMVLGFPRRVDTYVFKDGKFDYDRFKMVAQNRLGVSVVRFIEIQRRELLADKLREEMKVGIRVAPAEVKAEFEEHGLQVNLEFVRFSARKFEVDEEPPAAEVQAWIKGHEAELKKEYEERKAILYTKIDKQLRLRDLIVEVAKDATAETTAKAKARADEARKALDGGASFAATVAQFSTSEGARRRGGSLGWKKKGFSTLGGPLEEKVFAAGVKKGAIIGPERTDRGFEIVLVEDSREGDVSFEQAAPELAEAALLRDRAKQKAKAEAQAALDKVKKGEKLEVLFPPPPEKKDTDEASPEASLKRLMAQQTDAPALKETGLFSRRGEMVQEIGVSKELAQKAFTLKVGEVGGPYEVGGSYVIVRVKEHKDPDMKDFDKRRLELEREAARGKWFATVDAWSKQRCIELRDAGRIRVNDELMAYEGAPAAKLPGPLATLDKGGYVPCAARTPF
jgi:peptidyl-prolyl cis-trans isomerase D